MPSALWFALITMAAAFHLTNLRIRFSRYSSPGYCGSASGGIVLIYGVDTDPGTPTLCCRARSIRRAIK